MKSRYMARIRIDGNAPAQHVVAANPEWAWDTAQAKAEVMAAQKPGSEVMVELVAWRRGVWQYVQSCCHQCLQVLPDDYSTPLGAERIH